MTSPVIASAAVEIAPVLTGFGQRLGADIKDATRGAARAAADAGKQIGDSFDDATRSARGLRGALQQISQTAASMTVADVLNGVASSAQQFLRDTTQAASGLEQSIGAVDSVFKHSADQVHDWGQTSAESFGLSQRAFNEAVTPIGSLLKNLGFSLNEATTRTHDLTGRAADMAATFGGPTKDALDAISSALRGESDPIERYGVLLNEATVNARAFANTGKTNADALTLQEKAAARLNLIMEQTADTQGQFAREADTVAGAQQRLNATWEDAQAALGDAFAPVVRIAADVLTDLLGVFQELPGPAQFVVGLLAALTAAAVAIAPAVTAAATALGAMGVSAATMAAGVRTALVVLGPIGVIVAGVAAAIAIFGDRSGEAAASQEQLAVAGRSVAQAIAEQNGVIDDTIRKKAAQVAQDNNLLSLAKQLGVDTGDVTNAILEQGNAYDRLTGDLERVIASKEADLRQSQDRSGKTQDAIRSELDAYRALLDGVRGVTSEKNGELAAIRNVTEATAGASAAIRDNVEAYRAQTNALLEQRDAHRGLQAAIAEANATIAENGAILDVTTDLGRENQAALDGIVASTLAAIDADREKGVSGTELLATLDAGRQAFLAAADAAGIEADAARALADELGLIPSHVLTVIELRSLAAENNLAAFNRALGNIPRNIVVDVIVRGANISGSGGHMFTGNARGGPVRQGEWSVVGEEGPELVRFGRSARVFSNDESERMVRDVGALDGMTRAGVNAGRSTAAASTPAAVELTNNVDVQPTIQIYLDGRAVAGIVERVTIGREQRIFQLINTGTGRL